MIFLRRRHIFGYATAEQVAPALDGELGEGVEARRLLPGGRGGLESFGVGREVLAAVGGVEAFRQHDERGSGSGGFEDAGAGAGEVGGFVGAWGGRGGGSEGGKGEEEEGVGMRWGGRACCELHKGELEGFLEEVGHCRWNMSSLWIYV